jgi:ribonuclease P protein component
MRSYLSLRRRREFTLAMRRGRVGTAKAITVHAYLPSRPQKPKVGVIVTKKVGGAVVRNLVRRRCKAILDRTLDASSGTWYVIQCGAATATMPFSELSQLVTQAILRASAPRNSGR